MKKIALLLAFVLVVSLAGCTGGTDEGNRAGEMNTSGNALVTSRANYPAYTAQDGTWAIYLYICGSDLESNDPDIENDPYGMASIDISEVISVSLPENVNVVMQTGGALNWENSVDPSVLGRYRHGADGTYEYEPAPQASMGDPNTLADFLAWCNTNFPAQHQAVILWDHGGGSLYGYASDENFDREALSLPELNAAFDAAPAASGKYEIIGFDACLMATMDVVAALKDYGNYLVSSEDVEPLPGWNYTGALEALSADTSQPVSSFAQALCDSYYQGLLELHEMDERINFHQSATMSVVDLTRADVLLDAYQAMADEALLYAVQQREEYLSQFARAARASENYGGNTAETGYVEMVDLGDLANNAAELLPQSKAKIDAALAECVVYQVKGPLRERASGVACYYCYSGSPVSVDMYSDVGGSRAVSYYHEYSLRGTLTEEGLQYVNVLSTGAGEPAPEVEELAPVADLSLDDFPISIGPNGHWQLELGPERAQSIAAVHNYMLWDSGGGMQVLFGVSNEVAADWQNGVFTEQVSGMWGCLDDAQMFMRAVSIGDGTIVYVSPILLNGEAHNLFVAYMGDGTGDEEYVILGTMKADEEGAKNMEVRGPSPKDLAPLEAGDVLEPVHYFLLRQDNGEWTRDAFPVQSITVGCDPHFYEKSLGDGHFQMMFSMIDYAGNEYLSAVGDFKVKAGVIERVQGWETYPQPADSIEGLYVAKHQNSFNPQARTPYYTAIIDAQLYTDVGTQLGLSYAANGDQMSNTGPMGGGYVVEIFTNDPSINLGDYVAERLVYMTGTFVDGRTSHQRDIAFEVSGIMTAEGGTGGCIAAGSLRQYAMSTGLAGAPLSAHELEVLELATGILALMNNEDWGALGALVHPEQGLTFSPYGFVDTTTAVCLGAGDVKALGVDDTVRTWGTYDGSGEPIRCTFAEYYDRFIMSHDFAVAPQVAVNRIIETTEGSNLNVFGNGAHFVEFHFYSSPGEQDWASLRLVFAYYENEPYLVGIVHDEWTV